MAEGGRAAFIDTGTAFAVPRLLAALDALGLAREAVDWVIATHVHLDHAGGVGQLMQALPAARLVVHPRGARHMIDPTALWQGALGVYGAAQMARAYGELLPVDAQRVRTTTDGETLHLAGRPLQFAHTPGHALHHHCIWDARSQGWFTGDNFGMAYPEFNVDGRAFIFPTTTPVQFDPDAMRASIARLMAAAPRQMFLTHYSRISDVEDCADAPARHARCHRRRGAGTPRRARPPVGHHGRTDAALRRRRAGLWRGPARRPHRRAAAR